MKTYTKYSALAATILLFVSFTGPSQAVPETKQPTPVTKVVERQVTVPTASLSFDKVNVITTPAPIPKPKPVPVVAVRPVTAPVAPQRSTPAPTPARAVPVASGKNAGILASAYSQIGQIQDCTAMVERALGSIGIVTGDLGPSQFFRFGPVVSNPQPGDIMISAGHVGIYAGGGQMISGGFNGNQTVLHPARYVGPVSYVRVA